MDTVKQISICYIGELAYTPPKEVFLIERDEDYIRACRKLSAIKPLPSGLKMWVRSKNHFVWLKNFTEQTGCPVQFCEMTPCLVLAEKWNVILPDWLTDTDIIEQDLLNLDMEPLADQTPFESRFLGHFLGAAFQRDVFHKDDLVDVIKALVSPDARAAFKQYPLLSRCLASTCETWAVNSKEIWVKKLSPRLISDIDKVWQWLSLWACLHGYPEKLLEYVLSPEQVLLVRDIPVEAVRDLPLEPGAKEQILTQIEWLFQEIQTQVSSSEAFQKVLVWTSGRLFQEYQFISRMLGSGQFSPSAEDVRQVQIKFSYCLGVSESSLNSLRYCVPPSRPRQIGPEETWDSAQWIRWTTEEYMSYRIWQVHNNQYDEELERTVARFSDWFVEEYTTIHKDPDLSLIHCLAGIPSDGSKNQLSVILLVDCLSLQFFGLLDDALHNVGYSRHDLHYRFAALPTITEYNKPFLVNGQWQQGPEKYDAILKARSKTDWNNAPVIYLSNLKALSELTPPQESAVILLNYLDADELLHSDVESKGTSFEEEVHRLFARLAASLDRISKEWAGAKEDFSVYVVTDHGACKILEQEKQSFDSSVVNKLFNDEKHRFAVLDESQAGDVPDNLWALGYQFKQPFLSDKSVFFLPRGHNTVRNSGKAKGFLHGGVTPEEVVVPTALYKLIKTAWTSPAARFLNLDMIKETGRAKFYIQRVITVTIEVQNPNAVDLHVLRASVSSPETDLKSCDVGIIPAGSVNTIQMNCYFKKSALGEKNLEIEIAYEISGDKHTHALLLECDFKSAMASGFSLRDL
jgi:hypothetical protein